MDASRIEGIGHQIKGRLKEQFGQLIGDAKLTADGAAERVAGDAQNTASGQLIAGIDMDRITGVGRQLKGAGEQALGRLIGDAKLMGDGSAEISAGKAQNAAGSARDETRQAEDAERVELKPDAPKI
jgi:uncharacterized protein YjbJ (UPF0337 family)